MIGVGVAVETLVAGVECCPNPCLRSWWLDLYRVGQSFGRYEHRGQTLGEPGQEKDHHQYATREVVSIAIRLTNPKSRGTSRAYRLNMRGVPRSKGGWRA